MKKKSKTNDEIFDFNLNDSNFEEYGFSDNTKSAIFHLKDNRESTFVKYIDVIKQINKNRLMPLNISASTREDNLAESLEKEANSLIIYQMNDGIYYHQPADKKSEAHFIKKISDIEITEKPAGTDENKVILHFTSKRNRPKTSAEIKCSDDELNKLFSYLKKEKLIEIPEPEEIKNNFYGNMFYHSGITPEPNAEISADTDDDYPLFNAPFQDYTRFNSDSEKVAEKTVQQAKMPEPKPEPQKEKEKEKPNRANIIVNADNSTVNIYNGEQKAKKTEVGTSESTVTPMQGNYYVTHQNRTQNINEYDLKHNMERSGYSFADTGDFNQRNFTVPQTQEVVPEPIFTPTPPPAPVETPAPTAVAEPAIPVVEPKVEEVAEKTIADDFNPFDIPDQKKPTEKGFEDQKGPAKTSSKKAGGGKPSGFEVLLKETLPAAGLIAIGMVLLMGATLPFAPVAASGVFVLGALTYAYNEGIVHGSKSVFSTSGQAFGKFYRLSNKLFKNYSSYRKTLKERKKEAESEQIINLYQTDSLSDEEFLDLRNKNLDSLLTEEEKKLPDDVKKTIAMVKWEENYLRKKPLTVSGNRPKEISPFGKMDLPEPNRKFSELTPLDPTAVKNDRLKQFVFGEGDPINQGDGLLRHNENPYNRPKSAKQTAPNFDLNEIDKKQFNELQETIQSVPSDTQQSTRQKSEETIFEEGIESPYVANVRSEKTVKKTDKENNLNKQTQSEIENTQELTPEQKEQIKRIERMLKEAKENELTK